MEFSHRVICRHSACNRSFESHASMKQHYLVCHSKKENQEPSGRYACELCSKSRFRTKSGLKDHMRVVHFIGVQGSDQSLEDGLPMFSTSAVAPALLQSDYLDLITNVSCNDCCKTTTFKSIDALHQHQWASAGHTRVSKSPNPNHGTRVRTCSQCTLKLPSPEDLEQHFVEKHPISELPLSGEERIWQTVADRFRATWTKPSIKLYDVHRIFKVYNPGWRRRDFEEYRKHLKKQMSNHKLLHEENVELRNRILCDGNELQRYHGTTVSCSFGRPPPPSILPSHDKGVTTTGDDEASSLCNIGDCSLCRILQTGFQKSKCRVKNFQRFGKGIYCSSASSKSSAYVKCSNSMHEKSFVSWLFGCLGGDVASVSGKGNYKVMMVCRVIAGRPYHSTRNLQSLKQPPHGFHSVQGDPGEALNYDELVVYDDRAILPAYIILYTSSD